MTEPTAHDADVHFVVVFHTATQTWEIDDKLSEELMDSVVYRHLSGEWEPDVENEDLIFDVHADLEKRLGEA